jgi:hypothetical protein
LQPTIGKANAPYKQGRSYVRGAVRSANDRGANPPSAQAIS